MTVADGGEPGAGDDVLELGGPRRPVPRWPRTAALALGVTALLVGLAVGYGAGTRHAGKPAGPPSPSRPPRTAAAAAPFSAGGFPLSQSGPDCSTQTGRKLQVGLQITNLSKEAVRLRRVGVVLPLGGLAVTSKAWGPCGELPAVAEVPAAGDGPAGTPFPILRPGATAWFTVTFRVLVRCPKPLPVQFTLDYDQQGRPAAIRLPGFPDLGQVPYSGCR